MLDRRTLLIAGAAGAAATLVAPVRPAVASTRTDRLKRRLDALRYPAGVHVGVFFHELRHDVSFGWHADARFFTASVVKVDILAALLLGEQRRGRQLTASQQRLATKMIEHSDNAAANSLFAQIGGASGLTRANAAFGLDHTVPNRRWGLTTTTPRNQVRLLGRICDGGTLLQADRRAYARHLMYHVTASQHWGVSAARRKGETVLLKNGWMPSAADHQRWVVSSIGRIGSDDLDLRLAILSKGHSSYTAGVPRVERVADLVRDTMGW